MRSFSSVDRKAVLLYTAAYFLHVALETQRATPATTSEPVADEPEDRGGPNLIGELADLLAELDTLPPINGSMNISLPVFGMSASGTVGAP